MNNRIKEIEAKYECHWKFEKVDEVFVDIKYLLTRIKELEESDSWMLKAKEYLSNGNCPICFSTDEVGHTKGCVWGQAEAKSKELVEGIKKHKLIKGQFPYDTFLEDEKLYELIEENVK